MEKKLGFSAKIVSGHLSHIGSILGAGIRMELTWFYNLCTTHSPKHMGRDTDSKKNTRAAKSEKNWVLAQKSSTLTVYVTCRTYPNPTW